MEANEGKILFSRQYISISYFTDTVSANSIETNGPEPLTIHSLHLNLAGSHGCAGWTRAENETLNTSRFGRIDNCLAHIEFSWGIRVGERLNGSGKHARNKDGAKN